MRLLFQTGIFACLFGGCAGPSTTEDALTERLRTLLDRPFNYVVRGAPESEGIPSGVPSLHGTVVRRVEDRLLLRLDEDPPTIWAHGFSMAIYSKAEGYKGEVTIHEFEGSYALGVISFQRQGRPIRVGDLAASSLTTER